MTLAIIGASTASLPMCSPELDTARRFSHLGCVAGAASASPGRRLLAASGFGPAIDHGHCHAEVAAVTEAHAVALLRATASQQRLVQDVLHCQATLLERILESVCLRVAHACTSEPCRAMTIDQTGTAGVAAALFLGLHAGVASEQGLLLVTAADAWNSIFPGTFPPFVTYDHKVGALILQKADRGRREERVRGHVLDVACRLPSTRGPFWSSGPERARAEIAGRLVTAAEEVMTRVGWDVVVLDLLLGDPIGPDLGADLAAHLGVSPHNAPQPCGTHAGSASLIVNIERALAFARLKNRPAKCLLWTASAEGTVAVVALHAFPDDRTSTA